MLGGEEIRRKIEDGSIKIEPYDEKFIGPNSYDLHLGSELYRYKIEHSPLLVHDDDGTAFRALDPLCLPELELIPGNPWLLKPGTLYLGCTQEWTETDDMIPMIEGRSSIGRLGVFVHATAGFGDVGFKGNWTLELSVIHPVVLFPGMKICQICYHPIEGSYRRYNGRYQGDFNPVGSRFGQNCQDDMI